MIQLQQISKEYTLKSGIFRRREEKILALENIQLSIKEKECVGLIGLNGAGKSTLLKVILGILNPDIGEANLFGVDAVKHRVKNMKHIGVVFGQRPQLRWDVSPLDYYLLNRAIYNVNTERFNERLERYAHILGVDEFWNRPVRTLSLGQKMRADLLASLLHAPKLLILDEPTIGVDVVSKRKILDLIHTLKQEMTIIFTSHNLSDVYELCDRFIILNQGKVVIDDTKEEIAKKIGYVTVYVTLENTKLNTEGINLLPSQIEKENEFQYILKDISKDELVEYIQILFSNNKIVHFETKESDLESLLVQLGKESLSDG